VSEAAAAVRWLLQQSEPEARRVAVQQISKVGGSEACELLLRALGDDDWRVRKEAAAAAASLEPRHEAVAMLVAALEDRVNIGLRNAAVEALVSVGPDAVGATVEAMERFDVDARKLAVEVLGGAPDARSTAALVRSLLDDDANVRAAAAEALGGAALAGEESRALAIQALAAALSTSDAFLKIAALDSLARLEAELPWSTFEPFSRDPLLRRYAVAAAARSCEPGAINALARATGDPSPTISRDALVALGDVIARGPEDASLHRRIREELLLCEEGVESARRAAVDAEDPRARGGALLALGLARHEQDVRAIAEALADDDVAERADLALRLFGPSAARPLLEAARASRPSVRAATLSMAAGLDGSVVGDVRGALRLAFEDEAPEVVARAVEALGPVGDETDLRRVARLLAHKDERVAAAATGAISELAARHVDAARGLLKDSSLGQDPLALGCLLLGAIASTRTLDGSDIVLLQRALAHDDPQVRRAAVESLAQAGGEAAADAVVFALADEEHEVQIAAARALGRLRRPDALVAVVADTRDPLFAATALRSLGDADPARALAAARPLVSHGDAAIASAAVESIGHLITSRVLSRPDNQTHGQFEAASEDALFAALDHTDAEVVKLALSIVGSKPGPRALARLGLCLEHPAWEVRRLAAELLGQDHRPGVEGLLRARYDRERDPIVRAAIGSAVSLRPSAEGGRSVRGETADTPSEADRQEGQ
jgi:HEAT repeat protein